MKILIKNEDGFTHHILFIGIIIGVIALLSFTGRRVIESTTKAKPVNSTVVTSSTAPEATPSTSVTQATKPVTITRKGTAAAVATASPTGSKTKIPESVVIKSPYVVTTPEGSLNQLIKELKSGNFTNALYFISPRFMNETASLLKSQDYVTLSQCKANQTCNLLLNTPVEVLKSTTISLYTPADLNFDGKSLNFNIALEGNSFVSHGTSSAGDYTVKIDMIDAGTNWVVDRVTVNGFTI